MINSLSHFLVFFLVITTQWSTDSEQTVEEFRSDVQRVELNIAESTSIASALISSTSALHKWMGYRDFLDLAESIEDGYGYLYHEEALAQLLVRMNPLPDNSIECVDLALLAKSQNHHLDASVCLKQALDLKGIGDDSAVRVLLGRELAELGMVEEAQIEFSSATSQASQSGNLAYLFRIRQEGINALYEACHIPETVAAATACYQSEYPLERAWVMMQDIVYRWSLDEYDAVSRSVNLLAKEIKSATHRSDSDWERRRFEQISWILVTAQSALQGDPVKQMILDVESADMLYKSHDPQRVLVKLKNSIQAFPLEGFRSYAEEAKEWSTWAHYVYCGALFLTQEYDAAISGFRGILQNSDYNSQAAEPYLESQCWLAYCLHDRGQYSEAIEILEEALSTDAESSTYLPPGATDTFSQKRIRNGLLRKETRSAMVETYWKSLEAESAIGTGGVDQ